MARFKWRMDDDFDTPGALAVIFGAVRDARADPTQGGRLGRRRPGMLRRSASACSCRPMDEPLGTEVTDLVTKRDAARGKGDWGTADSIRSELQGMGYVVEDGPDGTLVRRALSRDAQLREAPWPPPAPLAVVDRTP